MQPLEFIYQLIAFQVAVSDPRRLRRPPHGRHALRRGNRLQGHATRGLIQRTHSGRRSRQSHFYLVCFFDTSEILQQIPCQTKWIL